MLRLLMLLCVVLCWCDIVCGLLLVCVMCVLLLRLCLFVVSVVVFVFVVSVVVLFLVFGLCRVRVLCLESRGVIGVSVILLRFETVFLWVAMLCLFLRWVCILA